MKRERVTHRIQNIHDVYRVYVWIFITNLYCHGYDICGQFVQGRSIGEIFYTLDVLSIKESHVNAPSCRSLIKR